MHQTRALRLRLSTQPGFLLSHAGSPTIGARVASRSSSHVGQTTILLGLLAMDAAIGFGVPLSAAAWLSPLPAACAPVLILTTVLTLCLTALSGGYAPRLLARRGEQVRLVLTAGVTATGVTALAAWAFGAGQIVSPDWALPASGAGLLGLAGGRALAGWLLAHERSGIAAPRIVVVGGGAIGTRLMRTMLTTEGRPDAVERVRLLGYVDGVPTPMGAPTDGPMDGGAPFLGGLAELLALIRAGSVDRVIIALPWSAQAPVLELIRQLAECPIEIQLARDPTVELGSDRTASRQWMRERLIHVMDPPLPGLASVLKRGEDIVVAMILLIPGLPLMAAIALLIRLNSPGPALFRQLRTGFNNRDFEMLKFRSMHHHLADPDAGQQVTARDPRVTRFGAFLRRSSLDELPQIFNVLRGDMSIVGPRPHAPGTRAGGRMFDHVVADYAARHRIRPGVTGLAQVRGLRGPTETEDKLVRRVDSDLEYIENWSVWLDMLVLARTAFAVLRMKNAC